MTRKHILAFIGFVTLAGTRVVAGPSELTLTADKAVQLALENNKTLHASLMRLNYADARSAEINSTRLPSLKLGASYTRYSEIPPFSIALPPALGGGSYTLSPSVPNYFYLRGTLEMPLFTGFRLSASADAAEYAVRASEQVHSANKADVAYNTKVAYWTLFKAKELKKVVDENVEQMRAHQRDAENLMAQGMATINDVLKVQVQLSEAQLRQVEADNGVRLALIGLNNAMGIPLDTPIALETSVTGSISRVDSLESLLRLAGEYRPELAAMDFRVKAAEQGITVANSSWWPQIYLSANYYYSKPNIRIQPVVDIFKDTWDVSLGMSLDIWNWLKTSHQSDQAAAQYHEAKDGLSQMQDGITLEVTQSYLSVRQAKDRTDLSAQAVRQAEESYRVTSAQFKEGMALNSDLLDAEVALLRAKTQYTTALVDHELAVARLHKAVGK